MDPVPVENQVSQPVEDKKLRRTIYDAGPGEIMFKNFLAGISWAIGGMFLYMIFFGVSAYIFTIAALPKIKPFIQDYLQAVQNVNTLNKNPGGIPLNQYQQMIQDLKPTP